MNTAINAMMDAAIDAILTSNLALWRPGGVYTFEIASNQLPPSSLCVAIRGSHSPSLPTSQRLDSAQALRVLQRAPPRKIQPPAFGEMVGIIAVFEYYLWRLNWPSIRQTRNVWNRENNEALTRFCSTYLHHVDVGWEDRESARAGLDGAAFEDLDALPRATHAEAPMIPRSVVHALLAVQGRLASNCRLGRMAGRRPAGVPAGAPTGTPAGPPAGTPESLCFHIAESAAERIPFGAAFSYMGKTFFCSHPKWLLKGPLSIVLSYARDNE
ncbi:hypothetical protein B0H17DRAFT_1136968 [Mycena rosella]|uniref:Uncharacterized protein n=1 Tax=Mycena rosella TaxID=1033263 RepID=A0AAD7DB81_MYCRO|nr:hypothetical protein B0H17DRAFT_1136968 [Mycena rosella]